MLAADLQKFIWYLQWVNKGILGFSELINPLHEFMENVTKGHEKGLG